MEERSVVGSDRQGFREISSPQTAPVPIDSIDLEVSSEDPDEIRNLAITNVETAKEMDRKLRQIVDYDEVHARVMRYNKDSFRKWRAEAKAGKHSITTSGQKKDASANTYEEMMEYVYMGWSAEHEAQLNHWLDED